MQIDNNFYGNRHCLKYILSPYFYSVKVFAVDVDVSCNCCRDLYFEKIVSSFYYKTYTYVIEIFVWFSTLKFLSMILYSDILYESALILLPDYPKSCLVVFFIISLYSAIQFSLMNRRKVSLHFIKSGYEGELEWAEKLKYYALGFFSLFFIFCMLSLLISVILYSKFKDYDRNHEAFGCCMWLSIWLFYISGQIISNFMNSVLVLILVGRRLIHLSESLAEAKKEDISFNVFLEDFIESHSDIWEYFQHVNDRWGYVFCLIYINFLYVSILLLYGVIFINMDFRLRIIISIICIVFLSGSISVSWALSHLTSLFYDNFTSIGRFSDIDMDIKYKYKMLDFMKRFGRIPIGISFAGFFSLKRNFVMKMVNGMYSAFSTLIQLTGVLSHKACSSNTNSTKSSLNF